jgi:hypothetical protein
MGLNYGKKGFKIRVRRYVNRLCVVVELGVIGKKNPPKTRSANHCNENAYQNQFLEKLFQCHYSEMVPEKTLWVGP